MQQQQQRLRASGFRPWSDSLPVLDTRHQRKHHDDHHHGDDQDDDDDDADEGVARENDDDDTTDDGAVGMVNHGSISQCGHER